MSLARSLLGLALALISGAAAAQSPLLIGVLQSDGAEPVLRFAFKREGARWSDMDPVAGQVGRPGFPAFADAYDRHNSPAVPLAEFGRALFGAAAALDTWYGVTPAGKTFERRAVRGEQGRWDCTRSWGLRLDAGSGAGDAWSVVANEPVAVDYFQASDDRPDVSGWQLTTPEQDNGAVAGFRVLDGFKDVKAPTFQPWQLQETRRLALAGGEVLLSVRAVRLLQPLAPGADRCSVPVMAATAVFRIDSSGARRRVDGDASVQRCHDGREPQAMSRPWALLRVGGETLLLHWLYPGKARRLDLHRIELDNAAHGGEILAHGAQSGC